MTEHQDHEHRHHHDLEKVNVAVTYTGKHDFQEKVAAKTTFEQIKLQAMSSFDIEASAASLYVLQYANTDVADDKVVGSLHHEHIKLRLMLKKEPTKG
jgi:hypothetical protein